MNYLTWLITQGHKPKVIQIDWGKEFINDCMKKWCNEQGIKIHLMAGYLPSQNGVAEHMHWTLTEILRAILIAQEMPEFLWEYAISHAVYLHNWSYTKSVEGMTPYQKWTVSGDDPLMHDLFPHKRYSCMIHFPHSRHLSSPEG
jgi:hypothetical protein